MDLFHVDAFAARPFTGNPAGVCLLDQPADADWMHAMAIELNLPKVAFVRRAETAGDFHLRWFGVTGESDFCGHATLAAAHVLWETGEAPSGTEIRFATLRGPLAAREAAGWIELDFPAEPATSDNRRTVAELLGVELLWLGTNGRHLLIEVEREETVRALRPDFPRLAAALSPEHGVIVTAPGHSGEYDFVSRCFAPPIGVDEDAVTGSAHCSLAPHWAAKLGKQELLAFQASARGGILKIRLDADRVFIAGQAVSVHRAHLLSQPS
jgi:PhzF family phenazine biosynthesis protein